MGADSQGRRFLFESSEVTDELITSQLVGDDPDGKVVEGTITLKRTGPDSYTSEFHYRTDDGGTYSGTGVFRRHRAN